MPAPPPVLTPDFQFNVKRFGATGNGTTDDYAAITAAVAAAKVAGVSRLGSALYFPPGKYMTSLPITLPRTTDTPTNVVQLVGDNPRTSIIEGNSSFPVNRALIEWEATTATAWHQRIARLGLNCPAVAGTKAIWHKANQTTINASTALAETLQLHLEDILIEGTNQYQEVLIDLEIGCRGGHWRNVLGDPARVVETYATLLCRTRYEYTSLAITSITHSGTTATVTLPTHGAISNQFYRIAGANQSAYNGTFRITRVDANTFTYVMASDPGADATGTLLGYLQPLAGADTVGFGLGRMEHIYPMMRRGGWCRGFEGRMYYATWDTGFVNGQRSGHAGNNIVLYNSWATNLQNISFEGSGSDGSAILRLVRCEHVNVVNTLCPIGLSTDSAWATGAKSLGARCVPTLLSLAQTPTTNRYFVCTTAGTSGGSEPTWGTPAAGDTVADGSVVWTAQTPALGNSIELSQCRACRINGRFMTAGNPGNAGRLVKALSIDAQCYDCIADNFGLSVAYPTYAVELEILAAASQGNVISGQMMQAFSDIRAGYVMGADNLLVGSATYDPPSLADGAGVTTTVTVTGAALGDFVDVSFSNSLQGIILTGEVSVANTVSVRFQNETGGPIDLSSGTLRAKVRRGL